MKKISRLMDEPCKIHDYTVLWNDGIVQRKMCQECGYVINVSVAKVAHTLITRHE